MHCDPEVAALLEEIAAAIGEGAPVGLPAGVYTSPRFHAAEEDAVFRHGWLCIGREDGLASPGAYRVSDIGALSIITLRARDGALRSFANSCRHRMTRLLEGGGNCRGRITCPYHAWTYRDDGSLDSAPHMEKAAGFDPQAHGLKPLRTELWEGFVFATADPEAASLGEQLAPIAATVGRYRMAGYGSVLDLEMATAANWKLIHENFMETYHLPYVHRSSLGKQEAIGGAHGFAASTAYSLYRTVKFAESPRGVAHPANTMLEGEWRRTTVVLSVFPTLLLIVCPDHCWYLLTHPASAERTKVLFGLAYAPEFLAERGRSALGEEWRPYYESLNGEDKAIVESIQRAARSPLAAPGRLSPLERYTQDLGRYLLAGLAAPATPPLVSGTGSRPSPASPAGRPSPAGSFPPRAP